VSGVAKKKSDKKKGELIEQNQDGLEVSDFLYDNATDFPVFSQQRVPNFFAVLYLMQISYI